MAKEGATFDNGQPLPDLDAPTNLLTFDQELPSTPNLPEDSS